MPRPTTAEIRRLLIDLGLDSVDPTSFFSGTFPEVLRMMVDAGPLKPLPTFNFIQNNTFTTGANTDQSFDITGANPGTIRVLKNMTIRVVTGNIDEIRIQLFDSIQEDILWQDIAPAFFPVAPYIGTDNTATQAWGALGLDNIVLYPPELTAIGAVQRQVQIRLLSAAAVIKTVVLHMNITEFDSRLFKGGDW